MGRAGGPGGGRLRLVCLPPAGVSAQAYRVFDGRLDPSVEPVPVEMPRTGTPDVDWPEFTEAVSERLDEVVGDAPHAFYGHSFGGRVAYEVSLLRAARGRRPAEHLFVGACRRPDRPQRLPYLHTMPDRELLAGLEAMGGEPVPELGPSAMRFMLRWLRRDLRLAEHWFRPDPPAVDVPLTAIYGTRDDVDDEPSMEKWSLLGERGEVLAIDAGHHFQTTHPDRVCAIINERVGS